MLIGQSKKEIYIVCVSFFLLCEITPPSLLLYQVGSIF